jgi:hypothetical protein
MAIRAWLHRWRWLLLAAAILLLLAGASAFVTLPLRDGDKTQRVSGLRFGDPMVLALFSALLLFRHVFRGFSNADLRQTLTPLLSCSADDLKPGRMTYHLRRLRLRGLIERIPKTHRYQVTETGLRTALSYVSSFSRVIRPTDSDLDIPSVRDRLLQEVTDAIQRILPHARAA